MHIRASQARGTPVVDDSSQQAIGFIGSPLIDSDTGKIHGFFLSSPGGNTLFLSAMDITAWGMVVHIRDADRVAAPDEFIRLKDAFADRRCFLGQHIRIQGAGRRVGVCADVQFSTRYFSVEWLFPRRFFFYREPLPITEVVEVTEKAIWVKNPKKPMSETVMEGKESVAPTIPEIIPKIAEG